MIGDDPLGLAPLAAEQRRNGMLEHEGLKVFAEVFGPPPRLVVVGAVDTGEALCAAAKRVGWRDDLRRRASAVRNARAGAERRRDHRRVARACLRADRPDRDTAVVVLTHDDKFDIPALAVRCAQMRSTSARSAVAAPRRSAASGCSRRASTEEQLDRLRGPAGLDIGAESPAETAVSILGEALALRAGRLGGPLREAAGRIHVER